MARTITAGEALGHRLMKASAKEDVIKMLGASDLPAAQRRRWYREWCRATLSKCRPEDVDRCAPPAKARERNEPLPFDDSSGRGAGQPLAAQPHVGLADDPLPADGAPKTAAASDAVTASTSGE